MVTIVAADKSTFLQTKPTLNIFNNTNSLNSINEIESTSFYAPIALINPNVPGLDGNVGSTAVPNGVSVYDFNFYYNTSGYDPITTANTIFQGATFTGGFSPPNSINPYTWFGDDATSQVVAFGPNSDGVAQLIFSVNPSVAYPGPFNSSTYPQLGDGFLVTDTPPTYDFNEIKYSTLMIYNYQGNVSLITLSYTVQATFSGTVGNLGDLTSMKGSIIVSGIQYDPFSPYYRQYVEWDVMANDIVVIRADYANQNCLVATLSNPNGDGSGATVKHSMLVPVPNGQYITSSGTSTAVNLNPFTYISVGQQNV
jgi:hypothetical protein